MQNTDIVRKYLGAAEINNYNWLFNWVEKMNGYSLGLESNNESMQIGINIAVAIAA